MLGIKTVEQMARDPLRGLLFENLVVGNLVKQSMNADSEGDIFFYRTSSGNEVDVLRRVGGGVQPIEIKSATTWSVSLADGLRGYLKVAEDAVAPAVVYGGSAVPRGVDGISAFNYLDFE